MASTRRPKISNRDSSTVRNLAVSESHRMTRTARIGILPRSPTPTRAVTSGFSIQRVPRGSTHPTPRPTRLTPPRSSLATPISAIRKKTSPMSRSNRSAPISTSTRSRTRCPGRPTSPKVASCGPSAPSLREAGPTRRPANSSQVTIRRPYPATTKSAHRPTDKVVRVPLFTPPTKKPG